MASKNGRATPQDGRRAASSHPRRSPPAKARHRIRTAAAAAACLGGRCRYWQTQRQICRRGRSAGGAEVATLAAVGRAWVAAGADHSTAGRSLPLKCQGWRAAMAGSSSRAPDEEHSRRLLERNTSAQPVTFTGSEATVGQHKHRGSYCDMCPPACRHHNTVDRRLSRPSAPRRQTRPARG